VPGPGDDRHTLVEYTHADFPPAAFQRFILS